MYQLCATKVSAMCHMENISEICEVLNRAMRIIKWNLWGYEPIGKYLIGFKVSQMDIWETLMWLKIKHSHMCSYGSKQPGVKWVYVTFRYFDNFLALLTCNL